MTLPTIEPMTWFGASWGAPINEICEHQQTPVGEVCTWCLDPIEPWAAGVVMTHWSAEEMSRQPKHLECFIRDTIGSVGHQLGLCHCNGGTMEDPPGMTLREGAVAAILLFAAVAQNQPLNEIACSLVGRNGT